jgi:antitoxin YefM
MIRSYRERMDPTTKAFVALLSVIEWAQPLAAAKAEQLARKEEERYAGNGRVYLIMYTLSMAKTVPVRELRSNLSSLLDDVSDRRDHVLVTRNGTPAAALVPIDEYEALEETAEILSDPDALSALEVGLAEIERDETVTLAELRSELAERRPNAS